MIVIPPGPRPLLPVPACRSRVAGSGRSRPAEYRVAVAETAVREAPSSTTR